MRLETSIWRTENVHSTPTYSGDCQRCVVALDDRIRPDHFAGRRSQCACRRGCIAASTGWFCQSRSRHRTFLGDDANRADYASARNWEALRYPRCGSRKVSLERSTRRPLAVSNDRARRRMATRARISSPRVMPPECIFRGDRVSRDPPARRRRRRHPYRPGVGLRRAERANAGNADACPGPPRVRRCQRVHRRRWPLRRANRRS